MNETNFANSLGPFFCDSGVAFRERYLTVLNALGDDHAFGKPPGYFHERRGETRWFRLATRLVEQCCGRIRLHGNYSSYEEAATYIRSAVRSP
jgi:hypothetical protein